MPPQLTTAVVAAPVAENWKAPLGLGLFSRAKVTAVGVTTAIEAWYTLLTVMGLGKTTVTRPPGCHRGRRTAHEEPPCVVLRTSKNAPSHSPPQTIAGVSCSSIRPLALRRNSTMPPRGPPPKSLLSAPRMMVADESIGGPGFTSWWKTAAWVAARGRTSPPHCMWMGSPGDQRDKRTVAMKPPARCFVVETA